MSGLHRHLRTNLLVASTTSPQIQGLLDTSPRPIARPSRERELRQRAVDAVLSGTRWLTAAEVGAMRDPGSRNLHSAPSRWLEQGRVFALEHRGVRLFPEYAFDELGEPIGALRGVLAAFAGYTPFRLAAWFESDNAYLGAKPRDVLATRGDEVVAAANRHVVGPAHG